MRRATNGCWLYESCSHVYPFDLIFELGADSLLRADIMSFETISDTGALVPKSYWELSLRMAEIGPPFVEALIDRKP